MDGAVPRPAAVPRREPMGLVGGLAWWEAVRVSLTGEWYMDAVGLDVSWDMRLGVGW